MPKAVFVGNSPKNNNWVCPIPIKYFFWRVDNFFFGERVFERNSHCMLLYSRIKHIAELGIIKRIGFNCVSVRPKQSVSMNDYIQGWRFADIFINNGNSIWFTDSWSIDWSQRFHIVKHISCNRYVGSLVLLKLPPNFRHIVLRGFCLLLGDFELLKPLRSFIRSVSVFNFRLAKDLFGLAAHLPQLQLSDNRIGEHGNKCGPGSHSYDLLSGVVSLLIGGALSFYSFWQPKSARNLYWYLLTLLLSVPFLFLGFDQVLEYLLNRGESVNNGCKFITWGHFNKTVPQKYSLTNTNYWGTVIATRRIEMANVLPMEKQIAVISALAEGSGIRQIERMTGVNRNRTGV
jgi:hypothetical protein